MRKDDLFSVNGMKKEARKRGFAILTLGALTFAVLGAASNTSRDLASTKFPSHRLTNDTDDILNDYVDYLQFALDAGRSGNPESAKRLEATFETLRRVDPANASRFLRGLRFELHQKLELMGIPPRAMSSAHPKIRPWAARFMPTWQREADEYLFRSRVAKMIEKK